LDILSGFDEIYVTHCTVSRILDEMCHYKNPYLESVIAYLEIAENITIISPDFEHQLQVREKAQYYEPESTIAIAVEKECPAIIGEPLLGQDVIDNFLEIIVRPAEIKLLV
jgi:hypothetical protein